MSEDLTAEPADDDVPAQAVKALTEATERARREGRTLVFVRDGQLVQETAGSEPVILKTMPPRRKVVPGTVYTLADSLKLTATGQS